MTPDIAIINSTTDLPDGEAMNIMDACQVQLDRDYAPLWSGATAKLHFVPRGHDLPDAMWWIALIDNADIAGALGYHDYTSAGLPIGKVFVKTTQAYGDLVSVTTSHEILEMVGDPDVNAMLQVNTRYYAWEMCDACEADQFSYEIDSSGVRVSDFVTPAYFEISTNNPGPYDFMKMLSGRVPALLPGGYMAYEENGQWSQLTADLDPRMVPRDSAARKRYQFKSRPLSGGRRHRRMFLRRNEWLPSTAVKA